MSNQEFIIKPQPTTLEYSRELAGYIEEVSCAVSVLGDLLKSAREDDLPEGSTQSLGFLLSILGDAMLKRSMDGYGFVSDARKMEQETNSAQ